MLLNVVVTGFLFHLAQIIVIGPQNLFVLQNGIKSKNISVPLICILLDILMILIMMFGVIRVLAENYWTLKVIQFSGVIFLTTYGIKSILAIKKMVDIDEMLDKKKMNNGIIRNAIFVSILNPGAWLDTVAISTVAMNYSNLQVETYFYLGIVASSVMWFIGISTFGRLTSVFLHNPQTWKMIHLFTGVTMTFMAIKLLL